MITEAKFPLLLRATETNERKTETEWNRNVLEFLMLRFYVTQIFFKYTFCIMNNATSFDIAS